MGNVAVRESRSGRVLGTVFLVVFFLFNALMLFWLLSFWGSVGNGLTGASEVERASATIGATVTTSIILVIWALGAILTGLLAMAARKHDGDAPPAAAQGGRAEGLSRPAVD